MGKVLANLYDHIYGWLFLSLVVLVNLFCFVILCSLLKTCVDDFHIWIVDLFSSVAQFCRNWNGGDRVEVEEERQAQREDEEVTIPLIPKIVVSPPTPVENPEDEKDNPFLPHSSSKPNLKRVRFGFVMESEVNSRKKIHREYIV